MYLLNNEIVFKVSPALYEHRDLWWRGIKVNGEYRNIADDEEDFIESVELSEEYFHTMQEQLEKYEK